MKPIEVMRSAPIIPVIAVENLDHAVPMARALVAGGLRVLEITLRTPVALAAIEKIAKEVEGAIVGVGTISKPEHFQQSLDAGAVFGISPGLTPELIAAAQASGLAFLPGVMTPSELIAARNAGFTEVKLFPAMQAGGIGMLKAMYGPFPDMTFCPTGGITLQTAPDFLALPNVACVGGSWFTPKDAMAAGNWDKLTELAKEAAALRA